MEITCNYFTWKILASNKASNAKESTSLIGESATKQNRWKTAHKHREIQLTKSQAMEQNVKTSFSDKPVPFYSSWKEIQLKYHWNKFGFGFGGVGFLGYCRTLLLYHVKLMPLDYFITLYGKIDTGLFLQ